MPCRCQLIPLAGFFAPFAAIDLIKNGSFIKGSTLLLASPLLAALSLAILPLFIASIAIDKYDHQKAQKALDHQKAQKALETYAKMASEKRKEQQQQIDSTE